MGEIHQPQPVLLIVAAFSGAAEAIDWGERTAIESWGPVALESETFEFTETDYYQPTMGPALRKKFFAFERLIDPGELPRIKQQTNHWEDVLARMEPADWADETPGTVLSQGKDPSNRAGQGDRANTSVDRPLNLDPGYVTEAKLVLASTKDHAHRIYLADGMYAEVTLYYQHRQWRHRDWTFPDYRRSDYHAFFDKCREYLRQRRREARSP